MADYALRVSKSAKLDGKYIDTFTDEARNWCRGIRLQGGPWQGSFQLHGSLPYLQEIFYDFLGYDLEERVGGVTTWKGLFYEMDLLNDGVRRRRSLDQMYNYLMARYTDLDDEVQESSWASDAQSIARYGRREEVLRMDGYPQAAAEARRDTILKEHAYPWPRPISANPPREGPRLEVTVCGYIFTANWRYVTALDEGTGYVNAWITDIVDTDCEFLNTGRIATNAVQVKRALTLKQRAWDQLLELTEIGDASQNYWRIYVENSGLYLSYQPVSKTPRYYLRGGNLYSSAGGRVGSRTAINPRFVQPAVVRDSSYPVSRSESGSFLTDVRDVMVSEVEVDAAGELRLKPDILTEEELLVERQEFMERQRQMIEAE